MRLALVLLLLTIGCASLATYNLFLRPLPQGQDLKPDATARQRVHLAVFGNTEGGAGPSSGGSDSNPLYQWTDASGNVRFTENPAEIPPGASKKVVR